MDARTQTLSASGTSARIDFWSALRATARLAIHRFQDDETLIQRARRGNTMAFDALEARYRLRIRELAIATLRSDEEAARAVRQTFMAARRDLHAGEAANATRAWLFEHALRAALAISRQGPFCDSIELRAPDTATLRHRMARAAFLLNERRAQRIW